MKAMRLAGHVRRRTTAFSLFVVGFMVSFAVGSLFATSADAYCRRHAVPGSGPSSEDEDPMDGTCHWKRGGLPVFWGSECVEYRVVVDPGLLSQQFTKEMADDIVKEAASAWTNAKCDARPPLPTRPSIRLANIDRERCLATERPGIHAQTANEIRFSDREPPEDPDVLATTWTHAFPASGELASAQVEVFRKVQDSSGPDLGSVCPRDVDMTDAQRRAYLVNVVRHELGHFLGFAHADTEDAVMDAIYPACDGASRLREDDRKAICETYPPDARVRQGCSVSVVQHESPRGQPEERGGGVVVSVVLGVTVLLRSSAKVRRRRR
jgi:hypothetical protein